MISVADLGDHVAAVIWYADTERRGRDASYLDLLGWGGADPVADRLGNPRATATSRDVWIDRIRAPHLMSAVRLGAATAGHQHVASCADQAA